MHCIVITLAIAGDMSKRNKVNDESNMSNTSEDKEAPEYDSDQEVRVCHLPQFNPTTVVLCTVIGLMALVLVGLTTSIGILFGEVSHLKETLAETKKDYSERLDALQNQLSNLPANSSSASFNVPSQEIAKVEDLEELKDDFRAYRHSVAGNFTTVFERQDQLEQQTNTSYVQLGLRLENVTANSNSRFSVVDENIASVNETVIGNREDIRELYTKNAQTVTRLRTVNDSVHELNIDQQQLKEETQANFSKLHSSFDQHQTMQDNITSRATEIESSLNATKSQLTSHITSASDRIDSQDDRIRNIETAQSDFAHTQTRHEDRITTLESEVLALQNSGTEQNTNILVTLTIVITVTACLMSG